MGAESRVRHLFGRHEVRGLIQDDWKRYDARHLEIRAGFQRGFFRLAKRLDDLQGQRHPMPCSEDLLLEAKWLLNYRADWTRLSRLLVLLEDSLKQHDQPARTQREDGSWAECVTEPYRKLEPTVDFLQADDFAVEKARPLAFMQPLADPATLSAYLWRLQTSDIAADGINKRDELGSVQSALSQLFNKGTLIARLESPRLGFKATPELKNAYADFMATTQHPVNGYWGPWYSSRGELAKVQDLSFTFHHVHFLKGKVANLDRIVATTLDIRDHAYPNGWQAEDGTFNNHNYYDVAQTFQHGWHVIDDSRRVAIAAEMVTGLRRSLSESLIGDKFNGINGIEDQYFGVMFLDRAGYFDAAQRFWRLAPDAPPPQLPADLPPAAAVATRLLRGFGQFDDGSQRATDIRKILAGAASGPAPPTA